MTIALYALAVIAGVLIVDKVRNHTDHHPGIILTTLGGVSFTLSALIVGITHLIG